MYIYIYMCTHTHIYIYIYICKCRRRWYAASVPMNLPPTYCQSTFVIATHHRTPALYQFLLGRQNKPTQPSKFDPMAKGLTHAMCTCAMMCRHRRTFANTTPTTIITKSPMLIGNSEIRISMNAFDKLNISPRTWNATEHECAIPLHLT